MASKRFFTRFPFTFHASCIVLALCLSAPVLLFAEPADQIFIMHSYSHEYPWTHGQHHGFIKTLTADSKIQTIVSTEYLDTKRRAYDETDASEVARHLRVKYADYKPAAIYVTDDNALLFARDHLSRIFLGTPVFFSGVNNYGVLPSLDSSLFTGVFELKEVAPNLEWLLRMDRDANDLIFIGDGSNTYTAIEREARKELNAYGLRATFIAEKRLDRALEQLHDQSGKYLFLTTLGGMTDSKGKVLPLHEIMKRLALTGRIVISMEDAYILEGVLGGYVTSGQRQGVTAARLLLAHLRGKAITDLPPILKSPNTLIFDDRVLQRQGIRLSEKMRAQAILLNPRTGVYEKYRAVILASLMGLAVLLFLVVTVSLLFMSRKNRELDIARHNAETASGLFEQIAEQSRAVHWEADAEGLFTAVSDVSEAVIGYKPEDIVGKKHIFDLHPAKGLERFKTLVLEAFRRKVPFRNMENCLETRNGRRVWLSNNGIPFLGKDGTLLGYRGASTDITGRMRAQAELLRRSEFEQLVAKISSELAGMSGGGIDSVIDRSLASIGTFTGADRAYVFQFKNAGTQADNTHEWCSDGIEPQIKNLKNIRVADELPWFLDQIRKLDIFIVPDVGALQREARLEREHFEAQNIKSLVVIPMKTAGSLTGFIGFDSIDKHRTWSEDDQNLLRFISETIGHVIERNRGEEERKKLQTQLIQTQKIESIGTLAGGIAHDFNNILSSIIGFTELALDDVEKGTPLEENLQEVYTAGKRARDLVRQILAFARQSDVERKPMRVDTIVKEVLKLIRSTTPTTIEIKESIGSGSLVMGNPSQVHQLLMNLCTNAAQAMEEAGGILDVRSTDVHLNGRSPQPLLGLKSGSYMKITVSDTGHGIPPDILESIFEPYFTTKGVGKGTGMGLALAHGIVESYGGKIIVESKLGKGTIFSIYLPITRKSEDYRPYEEEKVPSGTERILFVDDELPIVKMGSQVLERLGYQVTIRTSSVEALKLFHSKPYGFDLLITDMTMPNMTGDDLAMECIAARSDIPVILCTGYSKKITDGKAAKIGIKAFAYKPIVKADLAKTVRKVLDDTKGRSHA